MSKTGEVDFGPRATGLLVIEAVNSNPNGDPDRESDPRTRPDQRGEISPVSFKRKVRDLTGNKDGPVWEQLKRGFKPELRDDEYNILESRGRKREQIIEEVKSGKFLSKYWDARVFGNTFLEKEIDDKAIRTGPVQFGLGVSVAPVEIERLTTTNKSGVQEGKDRGMAPLAYRIVKHGVYCMPFFVNPTAAKASGCTALDVELLLKVIPYAYMHTSSYTRTSVFIRHAWYVEHKSALGSCPDFQILDSLKPTKTNGADNPSSDWSDYACPEGLPDSVKLKVAKVRDLIEEMSSN